MSGYCSNFSCNLSAGWGCVRLASKMTPHALCQIIQAAISTAALSGGELKTPVIYIK